MKTEMIWCMDDVRSMCSTTTAPAWTVSITKRSSITYTQTSAP